VASRKLSKDGSNVFLQDVGSLARWLAGCHWRLHNIKFQKMELFMTAAVRAPNHRFIILSMEVSFMLQLV
jgi:hypothetical protein